MEVNDNSSFSKFKVVTAILRPFLFNQNSKRIFQSPASFDDLKSQNGQCPTQVLVAKKQKVKRTEKDSYLFAQSMMKTLHLFT